MNLQQLFSPFKAACLHIATAAVLFFGSNTYAYTLNFGPALDINNIESSPVYANASVAISASGNAMAAWAETNTITGQYNAYAREYLSGSGWQTTAFDLNNTESNPPQ